MLRLSMLRLTSLLLFPVLRSLYTAAQPSSFPTPFPTLSPTHMPTTTPFPTTYPSAFPTHFPTHLPTIATTVRQAWPDTVIKNNKLLGGPTEFISVHMQKDLHHFAPAPSLTPTKSPTNVSAAANFKDPYAAASATALEYRNTHTELDITTVKSILGRFWNQTQFDKTAVGGVVTNAQLDAMIAELIPNPRVTNAPSFPPTQSPTPADYVNAAHVHCPPGYYLIFGHPDDLSRGKEEYRKNSYGETVAQSAQRARLQRAECIACPGGRYGEKGGLVSSGCSGKCEAGYFCPEGSTSAREKECGGSAFYCPAGRAYPKRVNAGDYSVGGSQMTRSASRPCSSDAICQDGVQYALPACPTGQYLNSSYDASGKSENVTYFPSREYGGNQRLHVSPSCSDCPSGRFGSSPGLVHANCSGTCAPGHLCPLGSISPTQQVCSPAADPSWYCPAGTHAAQKVVSGYYTVNAVAYRTAVGMAAESLRQATVAAATSAAAAAAARAYSSVQVAHFAACTSTYDQTGGAAAYTGSHPCNEAIDGVVVTGGRSIAGAGQGEQEAQTSNGWAFTAHPGAFTGVVTPVLSATSPVNTNSFSRTGLLQAVFHLSSPCALEGLLLLSGIGLTPNSGEVNYDEQVYARRQHLPSHHLTDFLVLVATRNTSEFLREGRVGIGSSEFFAPPSLRFLPEDASYMSPLHPSLRTDVYGSNYGSNAKNTLNAGWNGWENEIGEPNSLNQNPYGVVANRVRVRDGTELVRLQFDRTENVIAVKIIVLGTDTPGDRDATQAMGNLAFLLNEVVALRSFDGLRDPMSINAEVKASADRKATAATAATGGAACNYARLRAGSEVRCMAPWDASSRRWRACEVVSVRPIHGELAQFEELLQPAEGAWGQVKVHYNGYDTQYDEWVPMPSPRITCVGASSRNARHQHVIDVYGTSLSYDFNSDDVGATVASVTRVPTATTAGVEVLTSENFGGSASFEATHDIGGIIGSLGSSGSSATEYSLRTTLVPTAGAYQQYRRLDGSLDSALALVKGVDGVDDSVYGRSRRVHMVQCEPGYYCVGGERRPCPEGTFGATPGLGDARCSGRCLPGTYCPSTTATLIAAPRGGHVCQQGHYCPDGKQQWPCPAGYYGAESGLVSPTCNGPCDAGHYCLAGSTSARAYACPAGKYGTGSLDSVRSANCDGPCPPGYQCPAGSTNPYAKPCSNPRYYCPEGTGTEALETGNGYYALANAGDASSSDTGTVSGPTAGETQLPPAVLASRAWPIGAGTAEGGGMLGTTRYSSRHICEPGSYCSGGIKHLCPAGFYGNSSGLGAGAAGTHLLSTELHTKVAPFVNATVGAVNGTFALSSGRVWPICTGPCAPGHYCPVGSISATQIKCPAGRYGSTRGLKTAACSGLCSRGHYCPAGSTSPTERKCPAGSFGLEEGMQTADCLPARDCSTSASTGEITCVDSSQRIHSSDGTPVLRLHDVPTAAGTNTAASYSIVPESPRGGYLPPIRRSFRSPPASSGSFAVEASVSGAGYVAGGQRGGSGRGGGGGHSRDRSLSQCAAGYYCPPASTHARVRECGSSNVYCPEGSATPTPVSAGFYTVGGSPTTRSAQLICPPGHYCQHGIRKVCPAGRYGARSGLHAPSCTGPCNRGHYCRAGSTSGEAAGAQVVGMRRPGRYHPDSVGTQHTTSGSPINHGGLAQVHTAAPLTPRNVRPAIACPAGRYGSTEGLQSAGCEGKCDPGYFCPPASTHPQQRSCGHPSVYCPRGSGQPSAALPGYYTVGDYEHGRGGNDPTTRAAIVDCEPGTYCVGGVQFDCPAGTFGSDRGLSNAKCSGLCARGYYCPQGSISATEMPCPPGTYGATRGLTDASCSGPCMRGYDYPKASVHPHGRRSTGLNRN